MELSLISITGQWMRLWISPQQDNGVDCGVFSVMPVDNLIHRINPVGHLKQIDMPYFRNVIAQDLLNGKVANPLPLPQLTYLTLALDIGELSGKCIKDPASVGFDAL